MYELFKEAVLASELDVLNQTLDVLGCYGR